MVDRFSSHSLLVMATAMCVALLGLGLGAACDKDARAGEETTGTTGPARVDDPRGPGDDPNHVGGGPIEQLEDDAGQHLDNAHKASPASDPDRKDQPPGNRDRSEDDSLAPPDNPRDEGRQPASEDEPSDLAPKSDETSSPGDDTPGQEEPPDEENWGAPIRGSGGDDPPDFIVPTDPKQV